jgi:dienelactone hydrolase
MTEFTNVYSLTNAFDGGTINRQVHGFVAQPNGSPPAGGWPVAIAVNGHSHSAWQLMNPASGEYAGDAFARRGYLVVAVDVSHRNDSPIYGPDAYTGGDDPAHGNGPHPSIRTAALDSDWEEDGERAWDVQRAVDMVLARSDVNPAHIVITGLSMGGETATIAGALDPRISMVVAAGFSPDLGVIQYNGNHPCWGWAHANIRELIDVSDYEEVIAPRPFIIETGKQDNTFSAVAPYFQSDKQVARRARVPYADLGATGSYIHYLHYDVHRYHLGDASANYPTPLGVQIPNYTAPVSPNHLRDWQTDGTTYTGYPTVFQAIADFLP